MSGSPKYSTARLREEQERQLREDRRRREAAEQARREAEERRLRQERLEQARQSARSQADALQQQLTGYDETEAARFVAAELAGLRERLVRARAAMQQATDIAAVQEADRELERIRVDLRQTAAEGDAARLAAHLAREAAALARLRQAFATLDESRSVKFDLSGYRAVNDAIGDAEEALERQSPERAAAVLEAARRRLDDHRRMVDEQFTRWARDRERAANHVAEAADRIASLKVDATAMRWNAADVQALEQRVRRLSARLDAGQFEAVDREAAALRSDADRLVAAAGEAQYREDRRAYLVRGILHVMQARGFVVQDGFPAQEAPDQAESATIIYAQRIGGGALAVSVPQNGEIWYDVEGFEFHTETDEGGSVIHSCDRAEEQLEQLHQALDASFGIEMSELRWAGKPPRRRSRRADDLPVSTAQPRKGRTH